MKNSKFKISVVFLLIFSFLLLPFALYSQVRPVNDYGAIGLAQLLKKLNTTASVMMIGAHPDDEDSALLAYLARHDQARTAYLSLTRGDGGQNIIGSELFESLGVIRTEELLQARRLDGAAQFFTRAFDYGFSKTLAEAKQKWDEKIILCDTVRAIRTFRPLVVISRFSGTPADGHGQHQYSGYISTLAVRAAADSNQCKDSGAAWQVLKFYVEQGFQDNAQPTLRINTGEYDSLLGRSYFEIAMEGRSQHKSQGEGRLEFKGDVFSGLNLAETKVPKVENEQSVFDGIDTSLTVIPKSKDMSSPLEQKDEVQQSSDRALREYEPNNPQKILPILIKGWQAIPYTKTAVSNYSDFISGIPHTVIENAKLNASNWIVSLTQKEREFSEAIKRASGIQIDALADRETVVPDESFQTAVKVFFPKSNNIKVKEIILKTPNGWTVSKTEPPKETAQTFRRETANEANYFNVKVPREAKATEPYWLESQREGSLFAWQPDESQTLPFQSLLVSADVKIEIGGTEITLNQPVQYRYADSVRGEVRRDLNVVPKVSLSLDQDLLIVPQSEQAQTRRIVLSVTNNSSSAMSGAAKLNVPADWSITPKAADFNFKNKGEKTSFAFDITIPAKSKIGDFGLSAQAMAANGETFTQALNTIAYPHIQTHRFYTAAKTKAVVLDLKVAPVRVGYIMGSGDNVPEAIRQIGLPVALLNEADLSGGDLSKYDTIVVGIRASETRADFVANNQRLLDYVKNGGTLIVQYQRPDYAQKNLLPYPASMTDTQKTTAGTTARVVDENAKVTILDEQNPVFNYPNKISDEDFSGWVQERNLYNFTTFDSNYKPLLEAHDAGEAENKGGLVVANIGKGKYVYSSYAFFRQLPAGVPGAYRIFANLLSLPKAK